MKECARTERLASIIRSVSRSPARTLAHDNDLEAGFAVYRSLLHEPSNPRPSPYDSYQIMRNQEELIRQQQALEYYNNRLRQQQAQAQAQAQPRVLSPHEQQVAYYHQQLLLQQQYRDEMQARALREHQQRQEQATAREQLGLYGAIPPTSPYHAQPTPPAAQQPVQPPQYQHQPPASTRPPPPSYYDPNYTVVPSPSSHSQQERASSQEDEELQLALRLSLEESIALGQRQQQQQQQQVAAPSSLPPAYQVRPGGAAPTATTTANATSSASSSYMIPSPEPMSRPRLTAVQRQSMIMMHRSPSRLSFARDSIVIEEASKALDPLGFARYQIPGDGACLVCQPPAVRLWLPFDID